MKKKIKIIGAGKCKTAATIDSINKVIAYNSHDELLLGFEIWAGFGPGSSIENFCTFAKISDSLGLFFQGQNKYKIGIFLYTLASALKV